MRFAESEDLASPMTCAEFAEHAWRLLRIEKHFFHFAGIPDRTLSEFGWCTGAGAEFLDTAVAAGCDLFLTGDVSTIPGAARKGFGNECA